MVIDSGRYYNTGNWNWTLKFAWIPAKMDNSDFVWWCEYYYGVRIIIGPGTPVILHQYLTTQEFIWKSLKDS
jgi:hypothetical protein